MGIQAKLHNVQPTYINVCLKTFLELVKNMDPAPYSMIPYQRDFSEPDLVQEGDEVHVPFDPAVLPLLALLTVVLLHLNTTQHNQ
jgi:hypothetical protein